MKKIKIELDSTFNFVEVSKLFEFLTIKLFLKNISSNKNYFCLKITWEWRYKKKLLCCSQVPILQSSFVKAFFRVLDLRFCCKVSCFLLQVFEAFVTSFWSFRALFSFEKTTHHCQTTLKHVQNQRESLREAETMRNRRVFRTFSHSM